MKHRLRIPAEVAELIRGLHPGIKSKVRAALQAVLSSPTCGKPLKEELSGLRSYRIGQFRIIYRIAQDQTTEVVAVGPRRHIYQETYLKVSRDYSRKS